MDDPYEDPANPEITIGTTDCSAEDNANQIMRYLLYNGFLLDEVDERNYPQGSNHLIRIDGSSLSARRFSSVNHSKAARLDVQHSDERALEFHTTAREERR